MNLREVKGYTHLALFEQAVAQTSFISKQAQAQGFENEIWIQEPNPNPNPNANPNPNPNPNPRRWSMSTAPCGRSCSTCSG